MADPVRLQQLLWNVVKNAVKFTPDAGGIFVSLTRTLPTECSGWRCAIPGHWDRRRCARRISLRPLAIAANSTLCVQFRRAWVGSGHLQGIGRTPRRPNRGRQRWVRKGIHDHHPITV